MHDISSQNTVTSPPATTPLPATDAPQTPPLAAVPSDSVAAASGVCRAHQLAIRVAEDAYYREYLSRRRAARPLIWWLISLIAIVAGAFLITRCV